MMNYRVDRAAWVERSIKGQEAAFAAGASEKPMTADEMNDLLGRSDVDVLKATTRQGSNFENAQLIGVLVPHKNGRYTEITGEAAALYASSQVNLSALFGPGDPKPSSAKRPLAGYTALNVDFVLQNIDKTGSKNVAQYAEGVRRETDRLKNNYQTVVFTGANGKGGVTHDVDEYIGWLNEAAMKRASAVVKSDGDASS